MKSKRKETRLRLSFGQTSCRCGEQRIHGQTCGECGRLPEPAEIDHELQRRRQLVKYTRELLKGSDSGSARLGVPGRDSIMPLLTSSNDALGALVRLANEALGGRGQSGFADFAIAAQRLMTLNDEFELITARRPLRALRRPFKEIRSGLEDTVSSLLDALDSGTIQECQRHGQRVQPAIDHASESLGRANEVFDAWNLIEESSHPLAALVDLAVTRSEGSDLLDFASFGAARISERFPGVDVAIELGVLGSLLSVQASMLFDEDSFWRVARGVFDLVSSSPDRLVELNEQSGWTLRWTRSIAQAFWAAERFSTLQSVSSHEEAVVRAALEACHDMQEGLTKTVLSSVRYLSNPNVAFESLLASGTKSLVEWAVANGYPEAAALQVPTRNAFAHNDWSIDSGDIVLCELDPPLGGPVRICAEELEDHALAVQELTMAMFLGLVLAASNNGVVLPEDDRLVSTSARPLAVAVLSAIGWIEVKVGDVVDEVLTIHAAVERAGRLSDFVALAELFPSVAWLHVHAQTPAGRRIVKVDLQSLRTWSNEDNEACKLLAFAVLLNSTTVDGEPLADRSQVRRIVSGVTSPWIVERDKHRDVVAVFKKAREVAAVCHDPELLGAVKVAQGWRLSILQGADRPVADISEYLSWAEAAPDVDIEF